MVCQLQHASATSQSSYNCSKKAIEFTFAARQLAIPREILHLARTATARQLVYEVTHFSKQLTWKRCRIWVAAAEAVQRPVTKKTNLYIARGARQIAAHTRVNAHGIAKDSVSDYSSGRTAACIGSNYTFYVLMQRWGRP